jgi:hypothetical protein
MSCSGVTRATTLPDQLQGEIVDLLEANTGRTRPWVETLDPQYGKPAAAIRGEPLWREQSAELRYGHDDQRRVPARRIQTMMLDDLIVTVLLFAFFGLVTAIRLKARAQRNKAVTPPPSRAREHAVRAQRALGATS